MNSIGKKPSLLYITDLYYPARNRTYYVEDIFLTSKLKDDFDIVLCHPLHSKPFEKIVDLIVIRNSGPVIYYQQYFHEFKKRIKEEGILTYNVLEGKGDMAGKNYLVELSEKGFPVIPSVDDYHKLIQLPPAEKLITKPKQGADSIGLKITSKEELAKAKLRDTLIQPFIDFEYEVSFYFIDRELMYALYTPDKTQRWQLAPYYPDAEDVEFANQFVSWNNLPHGIQRVDACRSKDGKLLLVELEDLNPFLSLDLLDKKTQNKFIDNFRLSLMRTINEVHEQ